MSPLYFLASFPIARIPLKLMDPLNYLIDFQVVVPMALQIYRTFAAKILRRCLLSPLAFAILRK